MSDALLEVDDLHTHFHLKNKTVRAVNGVSFSIKRGEIVGIAGESGAGKSVACLSILRLVPSPGRIERGRILFSGEDLLTKSDRQMRDLRGQTVSMVFLLAFAPKDLYAAHPRNERTMSPEMKRVETSP